MKLKNLIQNAVGSDYPVEHRGATSLGISGCGEIDIFIPVPSSEFDGLLKRLGQIFGKPGSIYPMERARFVTRAEDTKAEVILINSDCEGWTNTLKFEGYLKTHPEALKTYAALEESCDGFSTREYYRQKNLFISEILAKCRS